MEELLKGQALLDAILTKAEEQKKKEGTEPGTGSALTGSMQQQVQNVTPQTSATSQPAAMSGSQQESGLLSGQDLLDAIWKEAEKNGNMPKSTLAGAVAGGQNSLPMGAPSGAGAGKNDFGSKAGRHLAAIRPVSNSALNQLETQKATQAQKQIDIAKGTNDETRFYDDIVKQLEADLNRYSELQMFYDDYSINPESYNGKPGVAETLEEYRKLKSKINETYGSFDKAYDTAEIAKAKRDDLISKNLTNADMDTLASWPEEDRELMDTVVAHTVVGLTDLIGLRARTKLNDKYGKDTVTKILETAERSENAKKAEGVIASGKASAGDIGTAISIPAGWLGTLTAIPGQALGTLTGTGRYPNADPYTAGTELGVWAENVQSATAEQVKQHMQYNMEQVGFDQQTQEIAGDIASGVYQLGVGVADNLARIALLGPGSLALAGASSFSSTYRQAAENGASAEQALAMGVVAGFLEVATEKIPLDNLLDDIANAGSQSWGSIAMKAVVQGGIELTTEEANYIGNVLAQAAILRERSDYNTLVRNAMDSGMSYEEAVQLADQQIIMQAGKTAAMAFFQGAGMSAAGSVGTKLLPGNLLQQQAQEHQKQQGDKQESTETPQSQTVGNEQLGANIFGLMGEETTQKTAIPEGTTVKVTSAGSAITEQNKSKNTLAYTLASNLDAVRDMTPVTQLTGKELNNGQAKLSDQIRSFFKSLGNKVFRNGLGDVELGEYGVGGILNHKPINRARIVSIAAVPDVIRNGRQIEYDSNWKGRGYESYTFAAPVTVNGTPVYVAAVVNKLPNNKFYLSEMVDSNGNYIRIEESPSGNSKNGLPMGPENQQGRDHAGPEGLSEGDNPSTESADPMSRFNNSIRDNVPVVNTESGAEAAQRTPITIDELTEGIVTDRRKEAVNSDAELVAVVDTHAPQQGQNEKRTPAADESVGAAPSGFDPISHLQYEYGTIPEGENAVRDDSLPASTDGKDRVSYTARTVKGAQATPDEFVDLIDKEVVKGGLSFIPIKNSDTVQSCVETVKKNGWMQAKADWHANVRAGKTGADMSAMGALLLNNAANAGDKAAWLEILHDYQLLGTNTAQGLQAFRILKTLAPEDKLYMIRRSVKQMVEDMKLDTDIELDENLLNEFEQAETDEARNKALDKIYKSVAEQIPSTFMDKLTAIRYMNMLGNLRTQVRNIAGNVGSKVLYDVKDVISAGLETVASELSGGKIHRTKSFSVSKEQLDSAKLDFDEFKDLVLGDRKFQDGFESTSIQQKVQDKRAIFKGENVVSKFLEGYRKATTWAMEQGDIAFSKPAYARALAGYLKANGITETDYSKVSTDIMEDARLYAVQQAQERTFRDTNWLSGWISKIGRRKDTPAVAKLLGEGILPFRKTPANVFVRAEEFSPLGVINSLYYSVKAMQKGTDVTGAQVIDSWAKTITGSGIFALGMLLKSLGVLVGGPDEDEKKEEFEELSGYQNYALQFGDESYTIDWLTPAAMPLLMGAELWEQMQNGDIELKDIEKALLSISDPMVKMSMLQGIDDTLENISYADSNLGQLAVNSALSYLTQGLTNTALGQIERSFEDSRMTTYVDKESAVPAWLQRTIGKASAKIPGWDYNQVPYINAWGEEEKNPQWAAGLASNMLSPGYYQKGVSDTVYKELVRLNDANVDKNVFPSSPEKDVKGRNLTAQEWTQLAKTQGQTARRVVDDIIGSEYYSGLSDEEKAKAIDYAYDYAREHARVQTLEDYDAYDAKWMDGIEGKEADTILRKVAAGGADKFASLPIDKAAMLSAAIDDLLDQPRETKPDGTSYTNVRTVQKVEAVANSSLTEKEQKAAMEDILDDNAYEKYLKILDAGYDTDDYAESYRIFADSEEGKAATIRELMREMNLTKRQATTLYEIYKPKK